MIDGLGLMAGLLANSKEEKLKFDDAKYFSFLNNKQKEYLILKKFQFSDEGTFIWCNDLSESLGNVPHLYTKWFPWEGNIVYPKFNQDLGDFYKSHVMPGMTKEEISELEKLSIEFSENFKVD